MCIGVGGCKKNECYNGRLWPALKFALTTEFLGLENDEPIFRKRIVAGVAKVTAIIFSIVNVCLILL